MSQTDDLISPRSDPAGGNTSALKTSDDGNATAGGTMKEKRICARCRVRKATKKAGLATGGVLLVCVECLDELKKETVPAVPSSPPSNAPPAISGAAPTATAAASAAAAGSLSPRSKPRSLTTSADEKHSPKEAKKQGGFSKMLSRLTSSRDISQTPSPAAASPETVMSARETTSSNAAQMRPANAVAAASTPVASPVMARTSRSSSVAALDSGATVRHTKSPSPTRNFVNSGGAAPPLTPMSRASSSGVSSLTASSPLTLEDELDAVRARAAERDAALLRKLDEAKGSLGSLRQMMLDFEPMYRGAPELSAKLNNDIARVEQVLLWRR
jgi:hypothetical protein